MHKNKRFIILTIVLVGCIVGTFALYSSRKPLPPPSSIQEEPPQEEGMLPTFHFVEEDSHALLPPIVTEPTPIRPSRMAINLPGVYAEAENYTEVVITCAEVSLHNKTVNGNVYLTESVGEGNVHLENMVITGTLYIYGGGMEGITLKDVTAPHIVLQKNGGTLGVVATGNTAVAITEIRCHAALLEQALTPAGSGFGMIQVLKTQKVYYDITLENVTNAHLRVEARSNIALLAGTHLLKAVCLDSTQFSGEGKISTLEVHSNSVSYQTPPETISVSPGFEVPQAEGTTSVAGGQPTPPTNLKIVYSNEYDSYIATFDFSKNSTGYVVTVLLDGQIINTFRLTAVQNTVRILENPPALLGRQLQYQVSALGGQGTHPSAPALSGSLIINRLAAPSIAAALRYNEARIDVEWANIATAAQYCLKITNHAETPPSVHYLYLESNSYQYYIDRENAAEMDLTFSVAALAAPATGMIDSNYATSQNCKLTVLPPLYNLVMEQDMDGNISARWSNPGGYTALLVTPLVDGIAQKPIRLSGEETTCALLYGAELQKVIGTRYSYKIEGVVENAISAPPSTCRELTVNGLEGLPAHVFSIEYHEQPVAGYYAVWAAQNRSLAEIARLRVTPILNGVAQPTKTVAASEGKILLIKKEFFTEGKTVTYTVVPAAEKVGQVLPPQTACPSTKTIARMQPPSELTLLLAGGQARFLFHFSPDAQPHISEYRITPILDGTRGESTQTILNYLDFAYASSSAQRVSFQVEAVAGKNTPLINSEPVSAQYTLYKNGAELVRAGGVLTLVVPHLTNGKITVQIPELQFIKTVTFAEDNTIVLGNESSFPLPSTGSYTVLLQTAESSGEHIHIYPAVPLS